MINEELKELPNRYCIKLNDISYNIVNDWGKRCFKRDWGNLSNDCYMIHNVSERYCTSSNSTSEYTEISLDQFKKWVLKEETIKSLSDSQLLKGNLYVAITKEKQWESLFISDGKRKLLTRLYLNGNSIFDTNCGGDWDNEVTFRYPTIEERQWYEVCKTAGKFVPRVQIEEEDFKPILYYIDKVDDLLVWNWFCENYNDGERVNNISNMYRYWMCLSVGGSPRFVADTFDIHNIDKTYTLVKLTLDEFKEIYMKPKVKEPEFIVGKWYKYQATNTIWYLKYLKTIDNLEWCFSECIKNGKYQVLTDWLSNDYKPELVTDLSEIQQYLPDGHCNKVLSKGFRKGDYLIYLQPSKSIYLKENYCYIHNGKIVNEFYTDLDSNGKSTSNHNVTFNSKLWGYATKEEIAEYDRLGKPYDVTTLNKVDKIPEYMEIINGKEGYNYAIDKTIDYNGKSFGHYVKKWGKIIKVIRKAKNKYDENYVYGIIGENEVCFELTALKSSTKELYDLQFKKQEITLEHGKYYSCENEDTTYWFQFDKLIEDGLFVLGQASSEDRDWWDNKLKWDYNANHSFKEVSESEAKNIIEVEEIKLSNGWKVGDKIELTGCDWQTIKKGDVATITKILDDKQFDINNLNVNAYISYWELVKEPNMEDILEEAKRRYPIGTKFKPQPDNKYTGIVECNGKYTFNRRGIFCEDLNGWIYYQNKWAEIVEQPKFKIGDWITNCKETARITLIDEFWIYTTNEYHVNGNSDGSNTSWVQLTDTNNRLATPEEISNAIKTLNNNYKVGDWVVVKNYQQAGEGNGVTTEDLITLLYDISKDIEYKATGILRSYADFMVKDNNYYRIKKSHIIKKATNEEIANVTKSETIKPKEWIPKIGDWIYRNDNNTNDITQGKVYQITKLIPKDSHKIYVINDKGIEDWFDLYRFRKAEPHEIPNCKLPLIGETYPSANPLTPKECFINKPENWYVKKENTEQIQPVIKYLNETYNIDLNGKNWKYYGVKNNSYSLQYNNARFGENVVELTLEQFEEMFLGKPQSESIVEKWNSEAIKHYTMGVDGIATGIGKPSIMQLMSVKQQEYNEAVLKIENLIENNQPIKQKQTINQLLNVKLN